MDRSAFFDNAADATSETIEKLFAAARAMSSDLGHLLKLHLPGLSMERELSRRATVPTTKGTNISGLKSVAALTAVSGESILFAAAANEAAAVSIAEGAAVSMTRVPGTDFWFHIATLAIGVPHKYTLFCDGVEIGSSSVAGYKAGSYPIPSAPRGQLSETRTVVSKIYREVRSNYWLYINPGIDEVRGAPMMVWHDGHKCVGARDLQNWRLQIVTDNLVHTGQIPPMVHILISPGASEGRIPGEDFETRSLQYDVVSDRYGQSLLAEILPEVEKTVKIRADAYSRGAAGESSGAISAFNLAWFHPESFSRVLSTIGSYTGLQWDPEHGVEGGFMVPHNVRREARRNIRIWMSDGMNDIEADPSDARPYIAGSWPLNNLQLANALKTRGYDFHFRFGDDLHSSAQGGLDLPESLAWLWRGYDPEKTTQTYEQDSAERAQPIFRVRVANREAW